MPIALITGASSGIGRDLAGLCGQNGYELILTARNEAALNQLAQELQQSHGARSLVLPADLADPAAPHWIFQQVRSRGITVDVLVNNAGFGTWGRFSEAEMAQQMAMLQVNVVALTALTRLFLPGMMQRKSGRILQVGSLAGFFAGPSMSTYYATKAYVLSHSIAVAREVRKTGVTVTCLCPGPTRTDFGRRAGMDKAGLFRFGSMDSMAVARAGYQGMIRGKLIVIPGALNKMLAFISRFVPRGLAARVAGKLNRVY